MKLYEYRLNFEFFFIESIKLENIHRKNDEV